MSLLIIDKPIQGRQCGECTACCSSIEVSEIQKRLWVQCDHLCDAGCGIYATRPESCRTFQCLWLAGNLAGDVRRRPDKLGLMFSVQTATKVPYPFLGCFEVRKGAIAEQAYLLRKIAQRYIVWIWPFGEPTKRKVIGPREWLLNLHISEASLEDEKDYSSFT